MKKTAEKKDVSMKEWVEALNTMIALLKFFGFDADHMTISEITESFEKIQKICEIVR